MPLRSCCPHLLHSAPGPQAAQPARRRPGGLFNVEHKPVTDALSKLPASYDGVKPEKKADAGKQPPAPLLPVPVLKAPAADLLTDAERMEITRLARMAGQAKESGVFFRLQLKPAPKESKTTDVRIDPVPKAPPVETDGGLATLSALRAADRALALAAGDTDLMARASAWPIRRASSPSSSPAPRSKSTIRTGCRRPSLPIS